MNLARRLFDILRLRYLLDRVDEISNNEVNSRGMTRRAFLFAEANQVQGDYFEFGIYRGHSFLNAHRQKRHLRLDGMKLWAFDSFQGLPEIDDAKDNIWHERQYAFSLADFRRLLASRGVRSDEYEVVAGYYRDSLNDDLHRRLAGRKAAIVNIDCDLYGSTVSALSFVERYLDDGTIVCFDDFYHYKGNPEQGEQRALTGFLQAHPQLTFIPWMDFAPVGRSFIVRRT